MRDHDPAYDSAFRWIVTSGIGCGLDHPIEWAINAWRTPGGTMHDAYYANMEHHLPRFLVEMYRMVQGPESEKATAGDVLGWVECHFPDGRFNGFFNFLRESIEAELERQS